MTTRTVYAVREPDEDGGPYGPATRVNTWTEAKALAESAGGALRFVDRIDITPEDIEVDGVLHTIENEDWTDFYAEHFEGEWLIENARREGTQ